MIVLLRKHSEQVAASGAAAAAPRFAFSQPRKIYPADARTRGFERRFCFIFFLVIRPATQATLRYAGSYASSDLRALTIPCTVRALRCSTEPMNSLNGEHSTREQMVTLGKDVNETLVFVTIHSRFFRELASSMNKCEPVHPPAPAHPSPQTVVEYIDTPPAARLFSCLNQARLSLTVGL